MISVSAFYVLSVVVLLLGTAIGLIIGSAVANGRAEDEIKRLRIEHRERQRDVEVRLEAVTAAGKVMVMVRDQEIAELRVALESEKRQRRLDLAKPAEWGTSDPAPIETT